MCVFVYRMAGSSSGECLVSVCVCGDNRIKKLLTLKSKSNGDRRSEGRRKKERCKGKLYSTLPWHIHSIQNSINTMCSLRCHKGSLNAKGD